MSHKNIPSIYYRNLAASIHRHLVGGTSGENRGIRRRSYYVLRNTSIPAVLVECGFLTNPAETRLILESSYRQKLADRIADGVMGKPTPRNRPVVDGVTHVSPPIRELAGYNDFVRVEPERRSTRRSSSKKRSSTRKKSSTSATKKKKKTTDSDE